MDSVLNIVKKYFIIAALVGGGLALALSLNTQKVNAAPVTGFVAGRIIDDSVFTNHNSMSVSQIQQFLNSKVPICDTYGTKPSEYGGGTRAQWGAAKYGQTVFTCLRDYIEGGKSSAQIIYDTSKEFQINPQVLLVLLQKEQSLVTDTWPLNIQYRSATGYGCPDTAPCDSQYYGLTNQIRWAARMFRSIMNASPSWYTPYVLGNNYVRYNPTASCGGSIVNIQNRATQALYNYTPYQPNQGALNAGWGSASCGAYGNRNFYLYFTDWFGSINGSFYQFKDAIDPPSQLAYGQTATAQLRVTNTSSQTWQSDGNLDAGQHPIRLMMVGYENNPFADTSDPAWLGTQNQIRMVEGSVAPGQTATFTFRVKAPNYKISSAMNMVLVQDGVQVYQNLGLQFRLNSIPDYAYSINSVDLPTGLLPGDSYKLSIKLTNTGTKVWHSDSATNPTNPNAIRLATRGYKDSPYAFPIQDPAWLGTQNQIKMVEDTVAPGQTATFEAIITSPYKAVSNYSPNFELVLDGIKFIEGPAISNKISTPALIPSYSFVSAVNPPSSMQPGQEVIAHIKIKNTGNMIWRNPDNKIISSLGKVQLGDTRMVTASPVYGNSALASATSETWMGTQNQVRMVESIVSPGQIATFNVAIKAPMAPGKYQQYFTFGMDGTVIMKEIGLAYSITVTP